MLEIQQFWKITSAMDLIRMKSPILHQAKTGTRASLTLHRDVNLHKLDPDVGEIPESLMIYKSMYSENKNKKIGGQIILNPPFPRLHQSGFPARQIDVFHAASACWPL